MTGPPNTNETLLAAGRIAFKPRSGIRDWNGWPDDVVDPLKRWNKDKSRLTFVYAASPNELGFCRGCQQWFAPESTYAYLDGGPVCDDCLIVYARLVGVEL